MSASGPCQDQPREREMDERTVEVRMALEAILFVSDEPISSSVLAQALETGRREVELMLGERAREYDDRRSGIVARSVAEAWRLFNKLEVTPYEDPSHLVTRHA